MHEVANCCRYLCPKPYSQETLEFLRSHNIRLCKLEIEVKTYNLPLTRKTSIFNNLPITDPRTQEETWLLDAFVIPLLPQMRMIILVIVDLLTHDLIIHHEPWIKFPGNPLPLHSSCYSLVQDCCFFHTFSSLVIWGENGLKHMAF